MEVKLYQIEVNHHLMSHRWRCCSLLSTAAPPPSPHGRNKGNFNSCDVMWGAIGTLHIDICYMLQLLRCCCSIVHCHYQWLYFAIIESCHNRCFISDVSSQYVTMGTVTECDTSRTNITFSAVNCPNVHCSYKHVSSPNLSSSLHKSECLASCPRIRPLVPWGEDRRAETLTSAGPDTELRYNISSSSPFSCSPPASLHAIKIGNIRA